MTLEISLKKTTAYSRHLRSSQHAEHQTVTLDRLNFSRLRETIALRYSPFLTRGGITTPVSTALRRNKLK